jgi:hypothetical protein
MPCHCDRDCLIYGDCCVDYAKQHWGGGEEELSEYYDCKQLRYDVSKCQNLLNYSLIKFTNTLITSCEDLKELENSPTRYIHVIHFHE